MKIELHHPLPVSLTRRLEKNQAHPRVKKMMLKYFISTLAREMKKGGTQEVELTVFPAFTGGEVAMVRLRFYTRAIVKGK